jgi:hypothetical protein
LRPLATDRYPAPLQGPVDHPGAFRHTLELASGLGQSPIDAMYREAGLSMGRLDSLAQEMDELATVPLLYERVRSHNGSFESRPIRPIPV